MTKSDPVRRRRPYPGSQSGTGPVITAVIAATVRSTVPLPLTHRPTEVGV